MPSLKIIHQSWCVLEEAEYEDISGYFLQCKTNKYSDCILNAAQECVTAVLSSTTSHPIIFSSLYFCSSNDSFWYHGEPNELLEGR